ncbi:MAG: ATP-binding protein [Chryseotalea sp. WA131a]|jgi:predicted AAA+ superfamily ATPase|nr:MAG: ATP-binding protein [Chryseotalea sp. WA131a]
MVVRAASQKLKQLATKFPVVGLLGPRQSGKTTLAKELFPKKPYVSFENQDTVLLAIRDPRAFLSAYKNGAVFDEIQRAPQLLSYLQELVDAHKKKAGLFVITGSQNLLLLETITQTLAGRIAFIQLLPFSLTELRDTNFGKQTLDGFLFRGGYPRLYQQRIAPTDYYPNYLLTYVERDVRQIKNISNLALFQRFLKICATRTGQQLNYSAIANDCGIDQKTVLNWLGILEASFIAFRLQPYYNNLGKRLLQMPKLYFYDTGLCSSLLEIENEKQMANHPLRGALMENLMIIELLKSRLNRGLRSNLFYWRDRTGNEIDLLLDQSDAVVPIEIKSSTTFHLDFLKGIRYWQKLNPKLKSSYLVFNGKDGQVEKTKILNWKNIAKIKN